MKNVAVIEANGEYTGSNLPVTRADFEALSDQRKLLLEFVAKQLNKDVDFGIIPGCKKPSLFKPGAEKLARLFGLGARFLLLDKTLERQDNFALYNYKCEVYHLKTTQVIAECEGTCNSQEKKFKERTVWEYSQQERKKVPRTEATPVCDILNTLQKMAQKRAYVGAVILATGASDFFTQDIDDVEDAKTVGAAASEAATPAAVPKVTKVTSQPEQVHDNQKQGTFLGEAIVSFEDKQLARDAGFKWDKDARKWLKQVTEAEAMELPFEVRKA